MAKLDQVSVNGTTYEIVPEIAPLFSESKAYKIGDCVIKDAVLYRFTSAHAAGGWLGVDAEAVTVGDELTGLKASLIERFGYIGTQQSVTPTFEQGAITNTGGDSASTTRVRMPRSMAFIPNNIMPNALLVTVPSGLKVNWREYNAYPQATSYTRGGSNWITGNFSIDVIPGYYYRLAAANIDDSDITPENALLTGITIKYTTYTDTSLTRQYQPADAKSTGDAIEALNDSIETLDNSMADAIDAMSEEDGKIWDMFYHEAIDGYSYVQGSINITTGGTSTSSTRIRSTPYAAFQKYKCIYVTIPEGLKINFRVYSDTRTPASNYYIGNMPNDWVTEKYVFEPNPEYYYRWVVAYTDDRNITPDDDILSGLAFYGMSAIENQKKNQIAPSSLLGNISIRAARTINFSDGTHPHIEWYLVQDINNNFYRTKDFVTKEYLFLFEPPTGYASDWAAGIDANNNVFFFKDAAGYDASIRLDDSRRENPVYYRSDENYTIQHTLDFGTGLKPAGWISNVGWCVLPNNDIVMCEYTRGTLATCNVWHVNAADPTDVNNWSATWSHEIIDTTDVTTPGVKHCHNVQYDFYTDIVYFSTGDSDTGSFLYYSTDNGLTWSLAYGPNKHKCRQVMLCFTPDKVFWGSDSYEEDNRDFFIATRDLNGIIDVENAREIHIGLTNRQACYGVVQIHNPDLIVLVERNDAASFTTLTMHAYDINADEIVELGVLEAVDGNRLGFRCKYVEWYPTGNMIRFGFNPHSGSVTTDTNVIKACGNHGGTTGDGSTRINNLKMYVYSKPNGYSVRFDTEYC